MQIKKSNLFKVKIYKILFMIAMFSVINSIVDTTKTDEYAYYYCSSIPYINKYFMCIYLYIILIDNKQ